MGKPGKREGSRRLRKAVWIQAAGLGMLGSSLWMLSPSCGGEGNPNRDPAPNSQRLTSPRAAIGDHSIVRANADSISAPIPDDHRSRWLDSLTVLLRREDNDELTRAMPMVRGSCFRPRYFRHLLDGDDFRIEAAFREDVHWLILWVDSKGGAKIEAFSRRPSKRADYPPSAGGVVNVNPADPAGVHLIALATGSIAPDEAALDRAYLNLKPPPADLANPGDLAGRGWMPEWQSHPFLEDLKRRLPEPYRFCFMLAVPTRKPSANPMLKATP